MLAVVVALVVIRFTRGVLGGLPYPVLWQVAVTGLPDSVYLPLALGAAARQSGALDIALTRDPDRPEPVS
jgi:hypothetical protein